MLVAGTSTIDKECLIAETSSCGAQALRGHGLYVAPSTKKKGNVKYQSIKGKSTGLEKAPSNSKVNTKPIHNKYFTKIPWHYPVVEMVGPPLKFFACQPDD